MYHPDDTRHVAKCADCRARLGATGLDIDLERIWLGVAAEVWATPVGPVERLAGRLLRSPGLARALLTTPSLVPSWIVATAIVLAIGVVATQHSTTPWVALLAPPLAGAGIAYAYGPGVDPAFELSQTMVISSRTILLVRGLAVFGLNALLGLIASLATASAVGLTLGWLVPMAAVSALALAAATLIRSANAGVSAALTGWAIIVVGAAAMRPGSDPHIVEWAALGTAVSSGALMPVYVACALACLAVAIWATSGQRAAAIGGSFPWHF